MQENFDFSEEVKSITAQEKSIVKAMDELKKANPQVFAELDKISEQTKEVETRKSKLKSVLEKQQDFDVHDTREARISLSRIVRIDVEDIEEVPDDYKETKVVANLTKAENHLRLYGVLPPGFINKSYSRLNWRYKE